MEKFKSILKQALTKKAVEIHLISQKNASLILSQDQVEILSENVDPIWLTSILHSVLPPSPESPASQELMRGEMNIVNVGTIFLIAHRHNQALSLFMPPDGQLRSQNFWEAIQGGELALPPPPQGVEIEERERPLEIENQKGELVSPPPPPQGVEIEERERPLEIENQKGELASPPPPQGVEIEERERTLEIENEIPGNLFSSSNLFSGTSSPLPLTSNKDKKETTDFSFIPPLINPIDLVAEPEDITQISELKLTKPGILDLPEPEPAIPPEFNPQDHDVTQISELNSPDLPPPAPQIEIPPQFNPQDHDATQISELNSPDLPPPAPQIEIPLPAKNNKLAPPTRHKEAVRTAIPPQLLSQRDNCCAILSAKQDWVDLISADFKKIDFFSFSIKSCGEAIYLLDRYLPKIIILDEDIEDFDSIFKKIYDMSTEKRLSIYVILLMRSAKSEDSKIAFSMSVDLVVNTQDVAQIVSIMESSKASKLDIYKIIDKLQASLN